MPSDHSQALSERPGLGLFRQAWWLDATAGERGWGEVRIDEGARPVALLRFAVRKRLGFTCLQMPPLTQTLGPWFAPLEGKPGQVLAREKELVDRLVAELPPHDWFAQNLSPANTNWLPWHWHGFAQTTRYTYALDLARGEEALWDGLLPKVRTDVRKATARSGLAVRSDLGIDAFIGVQRLTFARQGMAVPLSDELVKRLDAACSQRDCRRMFFAVDAQGRVHAAAYLVWDAERAYYLMAGGDPALRNSGAASLVLWEAIRFAAGVVPTFDFEGSMMEPVERFVRGFGAIQVPYHRISRAPSRLLGAARGLAAAGKALAGPRAGGRT